MTILEMIYEGLMTLDDNRRLGATRQELWKCIQRKHEAVDYKIFLVRLKKAAEVKENHIEHPKGNRSRFRLTKNLMNRVKT